MNSREQVRWDGSQQSASGDLRSDSLVYDPGVGQGGRVVPSTEP